MLIFDRKESVNIVIKNLNEIYSKLNRLKRELVKNVNEFEKLKKYDRVLDISFIEADAKTIRSIGKIDNLFNVIYDVLEIVKETRKINSKQLAAIKRFENKLEEEQI